MRSYGYVQIDEPAYLVSIVERGAQALVAAGTVGAGLAEALVAEAHRRAAAHSFFSSISYASLTATKPC